MKKIDFHIHPVPVATGESFVFSLETMKKYVSSTKLDAIAITNHNFFDETNYNLIKSAVEIIVFPGIELDVEKTHILVISPVEELDTFKAECKNVNDYMKLNEFNLSYDKYVELFPNRSKYLIIPHYKKGPHITSDLLTKFGNNKKVGEVSSAKKWFSCAKSPESLVPVLFSDIRIKEDLEKFPSTLTYISCDELTIPKIKSTLSDKTKVKISKEGVDEEFQILSDGTTASTGLNIIMGLKSSGKTYTLESILASFNKECVKYVEQFSIVKRAEDKEFKKLIENDNNDIQERNLCLLKPLVDKIALIDILSDMSELETYIQTLTDFAEKSENKDEFSDSSLFTAEKYEVTNSNELEEIIASIQKLMDSVKYRTIIDTRLGINNLGILLKDLTELICKEKNEAIIINATNNLIETIKTVLDENSALSMISEINFNQIA